MLYKLGPVAFIGGSLIAHGGQNIMEPCGLGVCSVHGPHMHNFNDAMEILRACDGSVQVTRETLVSELERLFRDPASACARAGRPTFGDDPPFFRCYLCNIWARVAVAADPENVHFGSRQKRAMIAPSWRDDPTFPGVR